jgi:hypothetical protein
MDLSCASAVKSFDFVSVDADWGSSWRKPSAGFSHELSWSHRCEFCTFCCFKNKLNPSSPKKFWICANTNLRLYTRVTHLYIFSTDLVLPDSDLGFQTWFDHAVTVADFFFRKNDLSFPQTAPNCWYSFRYGDVSPCDSLPSLIFTLLVICKIINGSSDYGGADRTPTPMPKSVQTNFLESINNLRV